LKDPASLRPPHTLAVTASTGIAGLNIGGSTVHSFAGIGLGKESKERLAYRIKNSFRLRMRWQETRTLIIDESELNTATSPPEFAHICASKVSMLDGVLFDKLVSLTWRRILLLD
jgi:ATP-dependent DNA helicase PIF1